MIYDFKFFYVKLISFLEPTKKNFETYFLHWKCLYVQKMSVLKEFFQDD